MNVSILGRYALGTCAATAMLAGCGGHTGGSALPAVPAVTSDGDLPHHHSFYYTGNAQSFVVPERVHHIDIVVRGAAGFGFPGAQSRGGRGARVHATIPVQPGERLYIFVGGEGTRGGRGGFNGGGDAGYSSSPGYGGGGASDVRARGDVLRDRILVAGGGGAQGHQTEGGNGGGGGREVGESGGAGNGSGPNYTNGGGGRGGTQRTGGAGGSGGEGSSSGGYPGGSRGTRGALGRGGSGGSGGYSHSGSYSAGTGGGGGGGYYGGGGGGGGGWGYESAGGGGGGGGGSSYVEPDAFKAQMWRGWKNAVTNGLVVISW